VKDISDQWAKIEGYREYIKEAIEALSEKYDLPKKIINQMAKTYHAGVYDQRVVEFEDFQTLYETIVKPD
jgi:hypothetical protein